MFHLAAYSVATGGAVTNQDLTAATDSELSQRNNHYILTEQYQLLAAFAHAASITTANILAPSWNQITKFNVWPVNKSATVPSPPQLDLWMNYPPPLPQNEEIQVQCSDTAVGGERINVFLWLGTPTWNQNLPRGKAPLPVFEARANFTAASITANQWSGLQAITFEQSLRGGTYALVGAAVQGTNLIACRFVFPRAPIYKSRKLRPGVLCQNAIGDLQGYNFGPKGPMVFGEYGRFSTFEPPQVEFWITTTGTPAVEMRLWLVWISDSMDVQYDVV